MNQTAIKPEQTQYYRSIEIQTMKGSKHDVQTTLGTKKAVQEMSEAQQASGILYDKQRYCLSALAS